MANELMMNAQTFCNRLALHQRAARQTTFAAPFAMHASKMCKITSFTHLYSFVLTYLRTPEFWGPVIVVILRTWQP